MGRRSVLVELVTKGHSVKDVAEQLAMSRKWAHKWLRRAAAEGLAGLADRSRARKTQRRFDGASVEKLFALRRKNPRWGARQLLGQLAAKEPRLSLPAASTLTELMRREGLLSKVKRQRRHEPLHRVLRATAPNDVWTIDFKGQFKLGDGEMCYPLTLRDAFSRKILCIVALRDTRHEAVVRVLAEAFKEHGLPGTLHSDTGAPFGSTGIGRLSQVSLFAMSCGVRPSFSRPGKPQDNGGHERMHRDLKAETAAPPAKSFRAQQRRFDVFRERFNSVRMHQALGMKTPDSVWRPSSRRAAQPSEHPAHWETRSVDSSGKITWGKWNVFVSHSLKKRRLGLEPIDDGLWRIHAEGFPIAVLRELPSGMRIEDLMEP